MTVKELIVKLQTYDENADAFYLHHIGKDKTRFTISSIEEVFSNPDGTVAVGDKSPWRKTIDE